MSDTMEIIAVFLVSIAVIAIVFGGLYLFLHNAEVRDCERFAEKSGLPTRLEGACWVTIRPGLEVRSYDFEKYFRFVEE